MVTKKQAFFLLVFLFSFAKSYSMDACLEPFMKLFLGFGNKTGARKEDTQLNAEIKAAQDAADKKRSIIKDKIVKEKAK